MDPEERRPLPARAHAAVCRHAHAQLVQVLVPAEDGVTDDRKARSQLWRHGPGARLAASIVQTAVISQFSPLGVVPDLMPALVACVGLLGGATDRRRDRLRRGFPDRPDPRADDGRRARSVHNRRLLRRAPARAARPRAPADGSVVGASARCSSSSSASPHIAVLARRAGAAAARMLWQILLIAALYGALLAPPIFRVARWAMLPDTRRDDPISPPPARQHDAPERARDPTIDPRRRARRSRVGAAADEPTRHPSTACPIASRRAVGSRSSCASRCSA